MAFELLYTVEDRKNSVKSIDKRIFSMIEYKYKLMQ